MLAKVWKVGVDVKVWTGVEGVDTWGFSSRRGQVWAGVEGMQKPSNWREGVYLTLLFCRCGQVWNLTTPVHTSYMAMFDTYAHLRVFRRVPHLCTPVHT